MGVVDDELVELSRRVYIQIIRVGIANRREGVDYTYPPAITIATWIFYFCCR